MFKKGKMAKVTCKAHQSGLTVRPNDALAALRRGQAKRETKSQLVRQRDYVYDSREAAIAAGWPDAEFGYWIPANGDTSRGREGWIALDYREDA